MFIAQRSQSRRTRSPNRCGRKRNADQALQRRDPADDPKLHHDSAERPCACRCHPAELVERAHRHRKACGLASLRQDPERYRYEVYPAENGEIRYFQREEDRIRHPHRCQREPLSSHPGLPERPEMGWNRADSSRPVPFSRCCGGRVHLRSYEDISAGSHQAGVPAGMQI